MNERSEGGSEIFRHELRDRELELTGGDPDLVEAVSEHLTAHVGEPDVFHEIVSDLVHVDVFAVQPGDGRDWITLLTSGMAERPMHMPDELEELAHAELTLALPADWPLAQEAFEDERNYWPIRLLKDLARLPHEFETFFTVGHTVPNGDPPEPYAEDTKLCCALIAPTVLGREGFESFEVSDGRVVRVYGVVPLHRDEMELKLDKGLDALIDLLDRHEVTELIDPSRPSVVARRRGLFRR